MDNSLIFDITSKQIPRYIAVEGPIGVGKTTLTKMLADTFNYKMLLETPETNPFLERFYQNPKQYALPTQLFFLFERAQKIQGMRQGDMFDPVTVADFLLEKDKLFAELNLDPDEMALYNNISTHLAIDSPVPDLVIYLQAPMSVLHSRLQQLTTGSRSDLIIDKPYLSQLIDAYTAFFHYYNEAPLLIVNASELDLANDQQDYQQFVNFMLTVKSGRHYYNPKPTII
jgi:deoxyguanosine kinase